MKLIRIKADYIDNKREYIIFNLLIENDKVVRTQEMCGYVADQGDIELEIYPFILKKRKEEMIMDYGAGCENETSKTNIHTKEIRFGELLTRWDGDNEYTYRISNITEIVNAS